MTIRLKLRDCCSFIPIWILFSALGCGTPKPQPAAWNVSFNKETTATIQVDLIGITDTDVALWENTDLDKYLAPGSRIRENTDKITLSLERGKVMMMPVNHEKWKGWLARGATRLLVIADLPGKFDPGQADRRRKIYPLDRKAWNTKGQTLEFRVNDSDVILMTPLKPVR